MGLLCKHYGGGGYVSAGRGA
eukprot:COSAG01_NODE_36202_length_520_cov_19.294537_1_plen_20_part_10